MKKSKTTTEKPAPKAKAETPVASVVTKETPKKTGTDKSSPKKAQAAAPKPAAATPEMPMSESVGLTAGSIWHYLDENGATSVAKLIKELSEDEKIIQRSIGWLAQEGKITLAVVNRIETIALKE
jgi:hypothetical protein